MIVNFYTVLYTAKYLKKVCKVYLLCHRKEDRECREMREKEVCRLFCGRRRRRKCKSPHQLMMSIQNHRDIKSSCLPRTHKHITSCRIQPHTHTSQIFLVVLNYNGRSSDMHNIRLQYYIYVWNFLVLICFIISSFHFMKCYTCGINLLMWFNCVYIFKRKKITAC